MSFQITPRSTISHTNRTVADLVDTLAASPAVLLAVWAHPDDETYLGAGLMSEVARRGGRIVNVCATRGEHGTAQPELHPPTTLGPRRERELEAALQILGVDEMRILGYEDGEVEQTPDAMGSRHIGTIIDQVQPDLVLSFGPDGVTGHPDHRAIGRWTQRALSDRDDRIPFVVTAAGAAWPEACVDRMQEIGAFWPGFPERTVMDADVVAELDGDLLDLKMSALACHESQIGPVHDALGPADYRRLAAAEAYRVVNEADLRFSRRGVS
jgi:LmbE family N-acetylglucosaminyl deacetylase